MQCFNGEWRGGGSDVVETQGKHGGCKGCHLEDLPSRRTQARRNVTTAVLLLLDAAVFEAWIFAP